MIAGMTMALQAPRANPIQRAINTLFSASEPGAFYDPSDMSTLFQDSAGTVPVTAVEQPVGLMLDKSGRGNHASQATSTKRPTYSRRVNLFTESEFRNGVTDAPSRAGLVSASTLPGYLGAVALGYDGSTLTYAYKTNYLVPANVEHTITAVVKMDDGGVPVASGAFDGPGRDFVLVIGGFAAVGNEQVVSLGDGLYRVSASRSVASANAACGVAKYGTHSARTFKVTAFSIRPSADAPLPYQRVNTATDYDADPAKFPAYLRFDGVDDAMQTGSINFTGTDKMTVWAGVTKLSDAAVALIAEFGLSLPLGGFYVAAPNSVGPTFGLASKGTAQSTANVTGQTAPQSAVLTGIGDIAGDIVSLRVNGVTTTSTQDQGTGSYGNLPLYLGARGGTSLFFNGRLYSLIVRGAQSSLSQIEATEAYIKQKMRLP